MELRSNHGQHVFFVLFCPSDLSLIVFMSLFLFWFPAALAIVTPADSKPAHLGCRYGIYDTPSDNINTLCTREVLTCVAYNAIYQLLHIQVYRADTKAIVWERVVPTVAMQRKLS